MTYKEILVLLSAGYTKDEIKSMENSDSEDTKVLPTVEIQREKIPVQEEKDSAQDTQTAEQAVNNSNYDKIMSAIADLTAALQGANRNSAEMGASIIDPKIAALNTMREIGNMPKN